MCLLVKPERTDNYFLYCLFYSHARTDIINNSTINCKVHSVTRFLGKYNPKHMHSLFDCSFILKFTELTHVSPPTPIFPIKDELSSITSFVKWINLDLRRLIIEVNSSFPKFPTQFSHRIITACHQWFLQTQYIIWYEN